MKIEIHITLDIGPCGPPVPVDVESVAIVVEPESESPVTREEITMLVLRPGKERTLRLNFTPEGATPDGVPEWATSDPAIVTITPAPDGISAKVKGVGIGAVVITADGDKKHGPEVSKFSASTDVQCQPPDVESVSMSVDPE